MATLLLALTSLGVTFLGRPARAAPGTGTGQGPAYGRSGDNTPVDGPKGSGCPHHFERQEWKLRLCLRDAFRFDARPAGSAGGGATGGTLLLGPRTKWPFLGGFRFTLQVKPQESLAKLRARLGRPRTEGGHQVVVSGIREVREGSRVAVSYRESAITMSCPAVRFVMLGPSYNYEIHYPDCGLGDRFHKESEVAFREILRRAVFW